MQQSSSIPFPLNEVDFPALAAISGFQLQLRDLAIRGQKDFWFPIEPGWGVLKLKIIRRFRLQKPPTPPDKRISHLHVDYR
jgi:hypothetical protein